MLNGAMQSEHTEYLTMCAPSLIDLKTVNSILFFSYVKIEI